jgi:xylulokinase
MKRTGTDKELFLGLDSSTQGFKATLMDSRLAVIHEVAVNFDKDLPDFKTQGGVHHHPDGLAVTSPPLMWVAALDLALERMKAAPCAFDRIAAISGSGQQHGSVWLKKGAREALRKVRAEKSLRDQLAGIFSVADSPIWMDSSTAKQCQEREKALGGAQAVANLTGSRAYERFTGNQIAKIYQTNRAGYDATERIALVSSFVASLLVGDYVSIDASDGSGMNLMDIRSRTWAPAALDCTAAGLAQKLGDIAPAHAVAGKVHDYFVSKYGFKKDCLVIVFSGDNPCSLAGLRIQQAGDIAISLGTSDTCFGCLTAPKPSATEGHIFANPVDPAAYMAMVCYKNGSLTREHVRDTAADRSWDTFNRMLQKTAVGNDGNIGFYIKEPEITPPILKTGITRFNGRGTSVDRFAPEAEVRAVLEGQFISMRLHGSRIGLTPKSILATGGASANDAILRVISDVFGAPVFVGDQANSASLGAAYRALHGWTCHRAGRFVSFADVMAAAPPFRKAAEPNKDAHAVYSAMMDRYEKLEKKVVR